jgi:hypothetical protein
LAPFVDRASGKTAIKEGYSAPQLAAAGTMDSPLSQDALTID